ncbi:unnamed protein product [Mucor fragilis]
MPAVTQVAKTKTQHWRSLLTEMARYFKTFWNIGDRKRSVEREEGLRKLKHEAQYFQVQDLTHKVNGLLEQLANDDEDYDYQVIQHPFNCNYLIVPSQGELKPFQEDDTIVTGFKYCLSSNAYESKLVVRRPRKKCKLAHN